MKTPDNRIFFYDCEFMEIPPDDLNPNGCAGGTIILISIGIVGLDGRELHCINGDADLSLANDWVKENVIPKLPPDNDPAWCDTAHEVARRVLEFLHPTAEDPVELWGYYSAYDHVALCWLFGKMVELPAGMPWYTRDIKQLSDSRLLNGWPLPSDDKGEHCALIDARWVRSAYLSLREREEFWLRKIQEAADDTHDQTE